MKTKKVIREVNGYRVLLQPDHHRAMSGNWEGYVYEHIIAAEEKLSRKLLRDEIVHHLDGNTRNNRYGNLLVLNRSQHSTLHGWLIAGAPGVETFGAHGVNSGKSKVTDPTFCECCSRTLQHKQKRFCSEDCRKTGTRVTEWPSKKQLENDIMELSWLAIGRKYGVSDNSARKWARSYGLL